MKKFYTYFKAVIITALFSVPTIVNAQDEEYKGDTASYPYWIDMMQNPDANFYAVQSAFNKFWENRDFSEGWGYKVYKRWEYDMRLKIDAEGNLPQGDAVYNSYQNYAAKTARMKRGPYGSNWTEMGPILLPANGTSQPNGLGRVNCVKFHPTDPQVIYAGAPSGGLWKTTDGGLTWESSTDDLPTLGVSAMAIDYTNPNIMYIGTGDRDGSNSTGMGVFKTTDGGKTWEPSNQGMNNKTVSRLLIHPEDPTILFAATNTGVYKSTNSGEEWTRTSGTSNFKDLVFKPNNPGVLYAAAERFVFRSIDSGQSFQIVGSGLPGSGVRVAIAVTPDAPDNVYALVSNQRTFRGLYLSTDSGESYTEQSTSPNLLGYARDGNDTRGQAWYDLDVAVEPDDASVVYVGGVNIWKSTNFGEDWNISAHWTYNGGAGVDDVHADQHVLEFSPHNGYLYVGNDGGVYKSENEGVTYDFISSGLAISQIYKIGQSANARNKVIAGFQDNGTAIYKNGIWVTEIGGDGMECAYSAEDSNLVFGALYYGDIRRSFNGGLNFSKFAGEDENGMDEAGAWVTPYVIAEDDVNTMYVGMKNVWRSNNIRGFTSNEIGWEKISDGLGSANANMAVMEHSPVNPDVLFVAKNTNKLYRTTNLSASTPTWKEFTMPVASATDIEAHSTNSDIIYMTGSKGVYRSVDGGQLWTEISGTLPNVNIFCIVHDKNSDEELYIGTDAGVYFYDKAMEDWLPYLTGLPVNIDIRELEIYYDENDENNNVLRAATYGRGMWETPLFGSNIALFNVSTTEICKRESVIFTAEAGATEWNWTFEGGTPATAITESVEVFYSEPGNYNVKLVAGDGNKTDSIERVDYINVCSPVSTDLINEETQLSLYPNPTNAEFTIDLAGNTNPIKIEMYDITGKRVRQIYSAPTDKVVVRTNEMEAGVYLIKVKAGIKTLSGKIVINN